jgi:Tfp pilus assembly protein PilO
VLQADVYRLQARLEHNNKTLPRQADMGTFIKDIETVSQQSAVQKFTCHPGAAQKFAAISLVPVTMNFEGDFISVFQFLRQSEDMLRLTRIRALNIRSTDARAGQVEVGMAMSVYFSEQ